MKQQIALKTFQHCAFEDPVTSIKFFSANFSKMRQSTSTLLVNLSFVTFFVAETSITCFLCFVRKVEKLNISAIYKSIIIIISANLPFIFIYKFLFKKKSNKPKKLQPSEEPGEHHQGEVPQVRLKSKLISYNLFIFKTFYVIGFLMKSPK